jgi:hypothetical protein
MRLLVEGELKPAGGIVGAGADEFRWPRPGQSCEYGVARGILVKMERLWIEFGGVVLEKSALLVHRWRGV